MVSVHVRDLAQPVSSRDRSPFWDLDLDLDHDAADFMEEEFSDKRSADLWHLNVHAHKGGASAQDLQAAAGCARVPART
jgi:hypothetical protein